MSHRRCFYIGLCTLLALSALSPTAIADAIVKTDGSRLEGRVISEDANAVTFETQSGGITMKQKIARAKIRSIEREVREGPGYCAIPLIGGIGEEVTFEAFESALKAARAARPRFVVLVIDSPGGTIQDMVRIVKLIDAHRDVEFVAYIQGKAFSAAAIIAMACPRIYVAPGATMGAAVPYQAGPEGVPRAIEAKIQSAILAQMRAAARVGGHDELWARAMTEMDLTLAVASHDAGEPVLTTSIDEPGVRVIKRADGILSMTATEAVAYGFAAGTADDAATVGRAMGLAAWHVADERPWFVMANKAQAVKAERQRDAHRLDRVSAHGAYLLRMYPEVRDIDAKLKTLIDESNAAVAAIDRLKAAYETELAAMRAEYDAAAKRLTGSRDAAHHVAKLKDTFRARAKELHQRYDTEITANQATYTRVTPQIQQLTARRTEITSAAPAID